MGAALAARLELLPLGRALVELLLLLSEGQSQLVTGTKRTVSDAILVWGIELLYVLLVQLLFRGERLVRQRGPGGRLLLRGRRHELVVDEVAVSVDVREGLPHDMRLLEEALVGGE